MALLALLTGCRTVDGQAAKVVRLDGDLLSEVWEPLSSSESRISIQDDKGEVVQRVAKRDPAKKEYIEVMKLVRNGRDGHMIFERRKSAAMDSFRPADEELVRIYNKDKNFKRLGIQLVPESLHRQTIDGGEIVYAVEQGGNHKCVVFFRYSQGSRQQFQEEKGIYEAVRGGSCVPMDSKESVALEKDMLDLAVRVLFDGGKSARSKMFESGLAQLKDTHGPDIEVPRSLDVQDSTVVLEGRLKVLGDKGIKSLTWDKGSIAFDRDGYFKMPISIPDGTNTITLVAVDTLGNRSSSDIVMVRGKVGTGSELPLGKLYALLIGVQKYEDPRLSFLKSPITDARAVKKILEKNYGYEVKLLEDPRRAQILEAIEQETLRLKENDSFVIYYAGHGTQHEETKLGYWVPSDGKLDNPDLWLPNSDIVSQLRKIPSRHVLLITDSCFSGTFTEQKLTRPPRLRSIWSRTVISSGGLTTVDDDDGSGHSPFARHLMDVLAGNHVGDVTDFSVFNQVRNLLAIDKVTQEPQYGALLAAGHEDGGGYYFQY
ncbi:MAG: caspase family protein [Magnetococcales bacterium]|nr:caspase family protein [Magnetococcales bacterium]